MIKSILVATDGSDYGNTACEYALYLARGLGARLLAMHVLDSRMLEGPLMADISGWVGAQPYGAQLKQFRELLERKGEAVIEALTERCEREDVRAETALKMGHPARVILEEEARAELLVLGQKGEHAEWIGDLMGSNVERIVRHSVKPCLVTPSAFEPFRKILVAYDGSAHASQALQEAGEMAAALDLEVLVLSVTDGLSQEKAAKAAADGVALAKDHNCRATSLVAEGDTVGAVLETAEQQDCNLIVVGAYGHSHIREMILGSTTTQLIARSNRPVMLVR